MPDANAISIPFPVYGLHQRRQHQSTVALQIGSTVITTTITYYYRTSAGAHGSTTNFNSIPVNSVIEARITT